MGKNVEIKRNKDLEQEIVESLRGKAIGGLIEKTVDCFVENLDEILEGKFSGDLIKKTDFKNKIKAIEEFSKFHAYKTKGALRVEAPGFQVIGGLLDLFVPAVINLGSGRGDSRKEHKSKSTRDFMDECLGVKFSDDCQDPYLRLLKITDFLSGCTDSYIVSVYKSLTGMDLRVS